MRPPVWRPPITLSPAEQAIERRIRRAKLFVWLRHWRHELLDVAFQAELAGMYRDSPRGQPPVPPAQLALATIAQAYTGVSDDEVLEATIMDRRWSICKEHNPPIYAWAPERRWCSVGPFRLPFDYLRG